MKENHARMNFPLSLFTEGAPVYEQKELRKQRRARKRGFANGAGCTDIDFRRKGLDKTGMLC